MSDITVRDYTSLYKIKQFMANNIAPSYFNLDSIDDTNVGLFGYITEILANNVEDSFFATTMLFKEIFPVIAEDPESIYLMASLFQLDAHFATPASLSFNLLLSEDDAISHATFNDGFYTLYIDRDMVINVEGVDFLLDYDIRITSKPVEGGYTHSAYYVFDWKNSISNIESPYIQTRTHTNLDTGKKYILMTVSLHQVSKETVNDTVLTNDMINVVNKEYTFKGALANFEVYYRENSNSAWTQMKKYMINSTEVSKDPSLYYNFTNDDKLSISFNTDERYFIPKYNSELKVELYSSLGKDGNFTKYNGASINISATSERYSSNKGLIFIGSTRGSSIGGYNAKTIEELRNDVIKAFSTVKSFTTASDLTLYFNSLRLNGNNRLLIIKQRDDALRRLFSTFVLFKDETGNIIPTNTVDMRFTTKDFDASFPQSNRYVIKAGKLLKFNNMAINEVGVEHDLTINDDLDPYENEYLYINPFLTVVGLDPTLCGYYINSIAEDVQLDFKDVNSASFNQFIVNSLRVDRNAVFGEDDYTLTLKLYPSSKLPIPAFTLVEEDTIVTDDMRTFTNEYDGKQYIDNNVIKAIMVIDGSNNSYIKFELTGWDQDCYYMTAKIKTNDFISIENKIGFIDGLRDRFTGEKVPEGEQRMFSSHNTNALVYTFLEYPDSTTAGLHKFANLPDLETATLTNTYQTNSINFVLPLEEIISTVKYNDLGDGNWDMKLMSMPVLKANVIHSIEDFNNFLKSFNDMYDYIQAALDSLTNNFKIDLKFFNTYGPSRHFYYYDNADESGLMDKINMSIRFGIKFSISTGVENAVSEIKNYIKDYIESDEVSLISAPSLYISNLIQDIKNNFQNISYITFKGVNSYGENIQKFESEVNDINVLESSFDTSNVIPEYLNIYYVYTKGIKTPQITIDVL